MLLIKNSGSHSPSFSSIYFPSVFFLFFFSLFLSPSIRRERPRRRALSIRTGAGVLSHLRPRGSRGVNIRVTTLVGNRIIRLSRAGR